MASDLPIVGPGLGLALLALAGLPLMTRRAGLSVPRRVVLGVLIVAALAVAVICRTALGAEMLVWVRD